MFQPKSLSIFAVVVAAAAASILTVDAACADEGGVGFWLPGQLGSLSAVPQTPGWNVGIIDYYTSVSGGGNVAAARQITIGKLPQNVLVNLEANIHANANLGVVSPGYVFATPILGGQLAVSMAAIAGRNSTDINGTLTAISGPLVETRQGSINDSRYGFGDLYPFAALRWNSGVNNWMTFLDGDIPVGTYDSSRLANFGIGHGSVDGGGGYTYFDPQTGHEFSLATGLTYKWIAESGQCTPQETDGPGTTYVFVDDAKRDRLSVEIWRGNERLGRNQLEITRPLKPPPRTSSR